MTPEQEDQVRRALAALGEAPQQSTPLPPEVAARLDDALAGLVAERAGGSVETSGGRADAVAAGPAQPRADDPADSGRSTVRPVGDRVDELAARRGRRRRVQRVLVAAAAVAAVAVGGGIATGRLGVTGSASSDSSASGASSGREAGSTDSPASGTKPLTGGGAASRARGPAAAPSTSLDFLALHRATLHRDVQRLLTTVHPADLPDSRTCRSPATAPGDRLLGVRLDGRRATLLLAPAVQGRRTATVYSCAGSPVASTTVPAGS